MVGQPFPGAKDRIFPGVHIEELDVIGMVTAFVFGQ